MAKDKDGPSKADRKAGKKPPRSSRERAEAADEGRDRKRSYSSLQQESIRRGRQNRDKP